MLQMQIAAWCGEYYCYISLDSFKYHAFFALHTLKIMLRMATAIETPTTVFVLLANCEKCSGVPLSYTYKLIATATTKKQTEMRHQMTPQQRLLVCVIAAKATASLE